MPIGLSMLARMQLAGLVGDPSLSAINTQGNFAVFGAAIGDKTMADMLIVWALPVSPDANFAAADAHGIFIVQSGGAAKPDKKMLFKASVNTSIYYDNVRVPREYRAAGPGIDGNFFKAATADAQWHSAVMALGIAERAFDMVLDYTGTRMGGFKPVRQHSMAAGIIADMAIGIEMMRAGVYNLSWMFDNLERYGPPFAPEFVSKAAAVRVYCGDTAVKIINKGAELLGSMSISEDFPYEKCLRDVKVTQLWLGGQQISRYRVACGHYDLKNWA